MAEITTPKSIVYTSKPLNLTTHPVELRYTRADLEFHGLDHSGWSYEAALFVNNPHAGEDTARTAANGFLGSFHVFGHGGCYGDEGHCDLPTARRPFDYRRPHPLQPISRKVMVTEGLRKAAPNGGPFTVTVVATAVPGSATVEKMDQFLSFEKIRVVTYRP